MATVPEATVTQPAKVDKTADLKKGAEVTVNYVKPDAEKLKGGLSQVGPAYGQALEGLQGVTDWDETGAENWHTEWYEFWADPMLCLLQCCACGLCCAIPARVTGEVMAIGCEAGCLTNCLTCCLATCYHGHVRTQMRKKYNLKGSRGFDCLMSYCCCSLLSCQEARELGVRAPGFTVPFTGCVQHGAGAGAPVQQAQMQRVV